MRPLTRAEARAIDAKAQETLGIPGDLLMENAGRAVAEHTAQVAAHHGITRVIVVAGPGNNGGDGFVAARHLLGRIDVHVALVGDAARLQGDALSNYERWSRLGGRTTSVRAAADVDAFAGDLERPPRAVVVDALFGIGLERPIVGLFASVIAAIERADLPVVAVDVPSGLDADTGAVLGCAVTAEVTVTFVAPKVGFDRGEGRARCGRVVVADIGFPPGLV